MSTKLKTKSEQTTDTVLESIPISWITQYAKQVGDKTTAEVLGMMICFYKMQQLCPDIAAQLADMRDSCNPVKRAEKSNKKIAKTMSRPHNINVQQMNCGNGTQSFLEKPINKYLKQKN